MPDIAGDVMDTPKLLATMRVARAINTTSGALSAAGAISTATYEALGVADFNPSSGLVKLGPNAFGLAITFLGRGADNDTINYMVEGVFGTPHASRGDLYGGYDLVPLAAGVFTLSTATLGADGVTIYDPAAAHGLLSTDRRADTITNTLSGSQGVGITLPASNTGAALLLVRSPGCVAMRVRTDISGGSATHGAAFASRAFPMFS